MKNVKTAVILLFSVLFVASIDCTARSHHFERTLDRIRDRKESASLTLPSWVLRAMLHSDDKELRHFLRNVDNMSMTSYEGSRKEIATMREELSASLTDDNFDALLQVNDGGDKVDVRMRSENGRVKEAVLFVTDASSLVVLHFEGDVDLKSAVAFSRQIRSNSSM